MKNTTSKDRSSTISIASAETAFLIWLFATNPMMMSSTKDVQQPAKESEWSKEADVYAEQSKERKYSSSKSRNNSKRRSSWKEKRAGTV